MAGRRQNYALRRYLKNTWETAFTTPLEFDFTGLPLAQLRVQHLKALLYNYRKYIRIRKLKNADEWVRLNETEIVTISPEKFFIHKKVIFKIPENCLKKAIPLSSFKTLKKIEVTEIHPDAAHLP